MILLDTCVLIFSSLTPDRLTQKAKRAIDTAEQQSDLYCAGISLWEIAMLVQKKRLKLSIDTKTFLQLMLDAQQIRVLPINADIAILSTQNGLFEHADPADRLIAATAIHHHAQLITFDSKLRSIPLLHTIW